MNDNGQRPADNVPHKRRTAARDAAPGMSSGNAARSGAPLKNDTAVDKTARRQMPEAAPADVTRRQVPARDNTASGSARMQVTAKEGAAADIRRARPASVERDYDGSPRLRSKSRRRSRAATLIGRILLVLFTFIFVLLFALVALCRTLVNGPSETVRDKLVLSAMQASATKWLPGLFLDDEVVREICERSEVEQPVTIPMGPLGGGTDTPPETGGDNVTDNNGGTDPTPPEKDEWEDAIDGMIYKTYTGPSFKAYILIVRDPSRLYVGTSSDYKSGKIGSRIFDIVEREGAIAGINGGEFSDTNGMGTGNTPIGLTYSKGECVWDDGKKRTFIGFDSNGVLHAVESMKKSEADALGIRDAVSFQTGNVLISNDGEKVTLHYAEGNVGMAQRTAIAQRADGSVILVVTDGRSASSLGATRNDIIDLLVSERAVVAGMLDGGSSTMMYYEDYYIKYDIDTSGLDEYQRKGLTNRYKAFTKPRHMPTFFLVRPEEN